MEYKYSVGVVLLLLIAYLKFSWGFDTTLDHGGQTRRWKFQGNYSYANSSGDPEVLKLREQAGRPSGPLALGEPDEELERREGVWYVKYSEGGKNEWEMSNSLSHLLFAQAWVTLIAHPDVKISFKTSGDKEVGKFWSDGKSWCDAIFNVGLHNSFVASAKTKKEGEYLILDKVVLGVMANITSLKNKRNLNPCLTSPPTVDDTAPDMDADKIAAERLGNELRRRQPPTGDQTPDMMIKTPLATSGGQSGSPSVTTKKPPLRTRTYQTESGGAKCDCVCTCAKPSNMTTTTSSTSTTTMSTII